MTKANETYPGPCGWNEYLARPYSGNLGISNGSGLGGVYCCCCCCFGGVVVAAAFTPSLDAGPGEVSTGSRLFRSCWTTLRSISRWRFKRCSSAKRSFSRASRTNSRSRSTSWFLSSRFRSSRKSTGALYFVLVVGALATYEGSVVPLLVGFSRL